VPCQPGVRSKDLHVLPRQEQGIGLQYPGMVSMASTSVGAVCVLHFEQSLVCTALPSGCHGAESRLRLSGVAVDRAPYHSSAGLSL